MINQYEIEELTQKVEVISRIIDLMYELNKYMLKHKDVYKFLEGYVENVTEVIETLEELVALTDEISSGDVDEEDYEYEEILSTVENTKFYIEDLSNNFQEYESEMSEEHYEEMFEYIKESENLCLSY